MPCCRPHFQLLLSVHQPGRQRYPRLQVIDGGNATGILDEVTGLLTEGYAVLSRDPETDKPLLEAYFTADSTWYYPDGQKPYQVPNLAPAPLLVFNYDLLPAQPADNRPTWYKALIQVHLYLPLGTDGGNSGGR